MAAESQDSDDDRRSGSDRRQDRSGGRREADFHGLRARYLRGCRCLPCRAANATYEYTRFRHQGGLVPAVQARRVLESMARQGVGGRRAAALAGISERQVWYIRAGHTSTIHPSVEAAILGIRPSLAHGCYVDAPTTYDAKRLLLGLLAEDFAPETLAPRLGVSASQVTAMAAAVGRGKVKRMRVGTVLRLRALWQDANGEGRQSA